MRAVQRIRHRRVPTPEERGHIALVEGWAIRRKKWYRRHALVTLLATVALVSFALVLLVAAVRDARVVTRGLVQAELAVVRAPARARVAEVLVQPGQAFAAGDALVRLEPLDHEELALRRHAVERQRLELRLARLGEDVGTNELGRRLELLARAELESGLAAADVAVAEARLAALADERARLVLDQEQRALELEDTLLARTQVLDAARTELGRLTDAQRLATYDAETAARLVGEGVVSRREELASDVRREQTDHDIERAATDVAALTDAVATTRRLQDLHDRQARAALAELDGRVAAARAEVERARTRRSLWGELRGQRADLLPAERPDARELHALQVLLLETDLAAAEARLAAEEERQAERVVVAAADGIVERVAVHPGAVVGADEALLRVYDPETVRVVAYAAGGDAFEVHAGARCTVVLPGGARTLEARILGLGGSLQRLPEPLADGASDGAFAVPLDLTRVRGGAPLLPNTPVRVVIERGSSER